jgi:hypothetical protein
MHSQEQIQISSSITIVALSDSHSSHPSLPSDWPPADVFIHTGDLTQHGTKEELEDVIACLATLPYQYKVVIAGNHDVGLDKECTYRSALASRAGTYATPEETDTLIATMKQNIIYLSPENPIAELHIRGTVLKIYGLPYSPLSIGPSAFMRPRSEDSWVDVHGQYDILLSHSPPRGYLDRNRGGEHVGCKHFLSAIRRVRPAAAVFGHIHEAKGEDRIEWEDGTVTRMYNVAVMNRDQTLSPATVFNVNMI